MLSAVFNVVYYSVLDSTNDEAKRLAEEGCADFTVVTAFEQRLGRGRRGRLWLSVPGNLYLSLVLRPALTGMDAARLSFVAAIAVAQTLQAYVKRGTQIGLKWPNDVLVNGMKISGILLETQSAVNQNVDWVVVGIGVNLVGAPQNIDYLATALAEYSVVPIDREGVIETLLRNFDEAYSVFLRDGFLPIRDIWSKLAIGIDQRVTVRHKERPLQGIFRGLDQYGALLLDCGDDGLTRITAGEIFFPIPEGNDAPGH